MTQPSPPAPGSDFNSTAFRACREYYLGRSNDEIAQRFYISHLLPTIITVCQQLLRREAGEWSPSAFVTIVSNNKELASLTSRVVGAKRVLLLHTEDKAADAKECKNLITAEQNELDTVEVTVDTACSTSGRTCWKTAFGKPLQSS